MRIGVAFPTTEIGNDPGSIRTFAREVEAMGYDHLTCIDHVIQGAQPVAQDWRAYYTLDNPFHEVMVLFGFIQMGANGWRALLWRAHVQWHLVGRYLIGATVLCGG